MCKGKQGSVCKGKQGSVCKVFETENLKFLVEMFLGCCLHSYYDFLLSVHFEM